MFQNIFALCFVESKNCHWYDTKLFVKMNRYSTVQRPEAALQRANDFISVGKEADALNALYEVIKVGICDRTFKYSYIYKHLSQMF